MMTKMIRYIFISLSLILTLNGFADSTLLHISPIPSHQTIQTPFFVNITTDTHSNGVVYLHTDLGAVSPSQVTLQDGQWSGPITLNAIGKNNTIALRWESPISHTTEEASSNPFDVTDPNGNMPANAHLSGVLSDTSNKEAASKIIQIYNTNPHTNPNAELIAQTQTDTSGHYQFNNLIPGNYYLQANHATIRPITLTARREMISNIQLPTLPLLLNTTDTPKVPVLLVPGIMGSTVPAVARVYPRLPFQTPKWDSNTLTLHDPFNKVGWNNLITLLKANGYIEGKTLFIVPYDWSLSTLQARDQFLIPWIQKAKQASGSDKVDIIAHSMGGLVAREYIQSADYQNDVRKLALVGTPNKGATGPYYIWEAGDVITSDIVAGSYGPKAWPAAYFYSNTFDDLHKDRTGSHVCQFSAEKIFFYNKPTHCDQDQIYDFVHAQGHSVGELLGTYDYLLNDANKNNIPLKSAENRLLRALDDLPCLNMNTCTDENNQPYHFKSPMSLFTPDASGVQTKLFIGDIPNHTPGTIFVDPFSQNRFYPDGTPLSNMPEQPRTGDSTVLLDSAQLDPSLPVATNASSEHAVLINAFKEALVQFVTGNTHIQIPLKTTQAPEKVLMISIDGIADPHLFLDGQEIAMDEKSIDTTNVGLVKNNPANGSYDLKLNTDSQSPLEGTIRYVDVARNQILWATRFTQADLSSDKITFLIK